MMQHSEDISPRAGFQEKALLAFGLAAIAVPIFVWLGLFDLPEILPHRYFLFFHMAVEIFSVGVAILVFAAGFHIQDEKRPVASLVLSCAFLGVGLLDFMHLMSYQGMPEFVTPASPHKGILFWLAARLLAAAALLAYVVLATAPATGKKPSRRLLLACSLGYVLIFGYLVGWHDDWFPVTFLEGRGLTPIKIGAEFLVILLLCVSLFLIFRRRCLVSLPAFRILTPALLFSVAGGLSFSLYTQVTDAFNVFGHVCKVFAYFLIYRSMFLVNIRMPMILLDRARVSLGLARDEWRKTFDAISDPMFIHDTEFRVTKCNRAYAEAAGLEPRQIIGRPYYEVLPRLNAPQPGCTEEAVPVSGDERETELFLADQGITYNIRFIPVKYHEGDDFSHSLHIMRDITERKKALSRIALVNFALNQVHESAFLIDENSRFCYVNDAACRSLGYHRDQLLGMGVADVDPEWSGELWPGLWLKLKTHASLTFEGRHRRGDGRTFPVEIIANYFEYEGSGFILALVRDITEQKRAEEASHFQFHFQKMVAELSAGFVATSPEEVDVAVNHALALCAGFFQADRSYVFLFSDYRHTMSNTHEYCASGIEPQIEAIKEVPLTAFPWFSRKILAQEVVHVPNVVGLPQEAANERTEFSRQGIQSLLCLPLVSGGRALGFFGLDAVKESRGWPDDQIALLSVVADIIAGALARHQTEIQLVQSSARLENAQRIAHIGNWDLDIAENTLVWSDEIYRIFGVAPQEFAVSYDAFLGYVHPDDREAVRQAVDDALERHAPYSIEHRVVQPGGGLRWVHEQAEIIRDETGRALRMSGTVQDITERKALEDQVFQSRKLEAIGVLAGGIAHDFNNILTPIMMYTQMVMADMPNDALARHSLEQVCKSAERARALVRQILDFSRQGKYEPQPMRLGSIVKEAIKFLRATIPANIRITCNILTEQDLVRADPTQMLQVVMNLTINASHAMPETGGAIVVTLSGQDDEARPSASAPRPDGEYLKLLVSDTGTGIPPEVLPRIFEPYFTTKGKGEGTGMGLAVVHGLVEKHGGSISVRSEVGKGTEFEVLLPVISGNIPTLPDFTRTLPGGREWILLVDDDRDVIKAAAPMLIRLGYRVVSETDGLEALTLFQANPARFDLVITDQIMPGMTGSDMAREMLRLRPDLPIILCTGFSGNIDEETAREIGFAAFVAKPFGREEIAPVIRAVLDRKQQRTDK